MPFLTDLRRLLGTRNANGLLAFLVLACIGPHATAVTTVRVVSPDQRNVIELSATDHGVHYQVLRDAQMLFKPSRIAPTLVDHPLGKEITKIIDVQRGEVDEEIPMPWGKSKLAIDRCAHATVTLSSSKNLRWQIELRAYDDGVAFRYRFLEQSELKQFTLQDEATQFDAAGEPQVLYNTLDSFTTSHESLYNKTPLAEIPTETLLDCPVLFVWPNGTAAAITEAAIFDFAGMYLFRETAETTKLRCRLSPLPSQENACVRGETPHQSPWRVFLLADHAGKLVESNLQYCLNAPPARDYSWAKPGKSSFHWWYGDFEDDYKQPDGEAVFVARHREYIDFCAENNIAYHAVSGHGLSWYQQSSTDYAVASDDADVRKPREAIGLPAILEYAKQRGVGIRLWVHWEALDKHLEGAMKLYESWGVKGLMVDFLDRDDQEMIAFSKRMLESAARHKIHIQIHGSSKYSGEQRTFPHLFNREGVLNLEYVKWSKLCTPQHSVNVAYTRALAGPVDFHLGGFRSVPREEFEPQDRAPVVMGTRCHNLALYVAYVNPMPMVADSPSAYTGEPGFEFIKTVPTTWDETRFLAGEPGEYFVIARRSGDIWYLGGITNWTPRDLELPLDFLSSKEYHCTSWQDGSLDPSRPNEVESRQATVHARATLKIELATGGGFVARLKPL